MDLGLVNNGIVDISALSNLRSLWKLDLKGNQIVTISALADNPSLGSGDLVDLRYNNLDLTSGSADMQDIEALQARGVDVNYIPQN